MAPASCTRRLHAVDPAAARSIGASNGRRIVRALEVIELTGEPFGAGLPDETTLWHASARSSASPLRAPSSSRASTRACSGCGDAGLLDEVRASSPTEGSASPPRARSATRRRSRSSMATLTEAEAIEQTAALTRRYARRQVGWFRRYRTVPLVRPTTTPTASNVLWRS